MKSIDLTFLTPQENLAYDEALLDLSEQGFDEEILRFWEPQNYFVVLGYACRAQEDVHVKICKQNDVPLLRRPSGGGTVLQGPGCLNFSLILKMENNKSIRNITETNLYVMTQHRKAIQSLTQHPVQIQGFTDLTLGDLKFSGNAQRRRRNFLLFHGTFLLSMDLSKIEEFLKIPPRQPDYRQNRKHQDFLVNLNLPAEEIKSKLTKIWRANSLLAPPPALDAIQPLIESKYSKNDWNLRY